MAISLQNLQYLLNKQAAQAQQDAGSQAMMMAAQAARPAGAPPLPKPVDVEEESAEGPDTEKIIQEKDSEIEKAKKENESLRHELNKRELEYQRESMLREVEQKEKAGLDAISKERQNLQSELTKYQAEEIKHKANMDKYTAEAEVKLEQQKSKAIIDYTKQQTNIQQKAVDEARRKADEIKQQAEKYREQQSRDAEQYRQQITGEIDKYKTQASQDIADEREALRTSATGTSPALQYMLDDALKALGSIPTPGANPIKMPKQATIVPTTKLNIVETVSNKVNSHIKQARVVSQAYSNVLAKGITVPVPGFYPAVSNTPAFVDIITLNKQAGVKDDFLNQRLIPQLQAMLADPEFQAYIAKVAQTQNLQEPLPAKFTLGGLLDGVTAQDAMLIMSGNYEPIKNKAMKNAQNAIFTWINTPEGKKYIAQNIHKLGSTPEELSAIGLPPQIFGGLLKDYTVGDLLQAAQEENYQWVVDGNNLASAAGLHSIIEKAKKDYGINFKYNQDPTVDRIPDLSPEKSILLGLVGSLFPQYVADEANGKIDEVIKNVIQKVNVPGLDKHLLLEELADPTSHISDIIYGISDNTASQGTDKKLGFQTALLNDNDQQLIVKLWPHISPRNRAILAGLLHPQYRNSVNWKRPAKPQQASVQPAKGEAAPAKQQPGVDPSKPQPAAQPAPVNQQPGVQQPAVQPAPAPVNQQPAGQPVKQEGQQQSQPSNAKHDTDYIIKSEFPLNAPGLVPIGMVTGKDGNQYYGYKRQSGSSAKGNVLVTGSPAAAKQNVPQQPATGGQQEPAQGAQGAQPAQAAPQQGTNAPTGQPGGGNTAVAKPKGIVIKSEYPLNTPGLVPLGQRKGRDGKMYYEYTQVNKTNAPKPQEPEAPTPETPTPEVPKPEVPVAKAPKQEAPKQEAPKPEVLKSETPALANNIAGQGSLTPKHSRVPYGKWDQTTGGTYSSLATVLGMLGVQVPQYIPDNGGRFKRKLKADKLQKEIGLYYKDSRLADYNPNYRLAQQTSPGGATLLGQFNQV